MLFERLNEKYQFTIVEMEQLLHAKILKDAIMPNGEVYDVETRLAILLAGEGFSTLGEMMMQLEIDEDIILALNGVGPKAMETIKEAIENFEMPAEEIEEEVAEESAETETDEPEDGAEELAEEDQEAEVVDESETEVEEKEDVSFEEALETHEADEASKKEKIFTEDKIKEDPSGLFPEDKKPQQKKKKKYRAIEYDPDHDVTIVRKRRKGEDEWEDENWTG